MPTTFYMDAHIPRAITLGLRMRKVDVVTAQQDGADTLPDAELLDRATHLNRVLFTFDDDLLVEVVKDSANIDHSAGSFTPTLCAFRLDSASRTWS